MNNIISNNKTNKINWDLNPEQMPEIEKDINLLEKKLQSTNCSEQLNDTFSLWKRSVKTEIKKTLKFAKSDMRAEKCIAQAVRSPMYSGILPSMLRISNEVKQHFNKINARQNMSHLYIGYQEKLHSFLKNLATLIIPKVAATLLDNKILTEEELKKRLEIAINYETPKDILCGGEISHEYKRLKNLFKIFKGIETDNENMKEILTFMNNKTEKDFNDPCFDEVKTILNHSLASSIIGSIERNIRLMEDGKL